MKAIGIDIGTTTVCGIVVDVETAEVCNVRTLSNDSVIRNSESGYTQDPEKIWGIVSNIYDEFTGLHSDICSIGITGQMHGIVYIDEGGKAVSPLYTWQDERGDWSAPSGKSYAEELSSLTGCAMSTGFGLTTHYVLTKQNKIPDNAVGLCTIPDYIGLCLTGCKKPIISPSMGASLGCFDIEKGEFCKETIRRAGMDTSFLPDCIGGYTVLGKTLSGIPVGVAIGDNQASVLGSVKNVKESVLFNIGTGGQVSTGVDHYIETEYVELRPLIDEQYIMVGSSLCGGRAYAALERFFTETVIAMTGEKPGTALYKRMSELLEQNISCEQKLVVNTRFCGTRENPEERGSITNISLDNFSPYALIQATLQGMAEELASFHRQMLEQGAETPKYLVGSGNGLRLNPGLKKIFEEMYHLKMQIPKHHEEAAFGVALYAMCAAGVVESMEQAQELITYI